MKTNWVRRTIGEKKKVRAKIKPAKIFRYKYELILALNNDWDWAGQEKRRGELKKNNNEEINIVVNYRIIVNKLHKWTKWHKELYHLLESLPVDLIKSWNLYDDFGSVKGLSLLIFATFLWPAAARGTPPPPTTTTTTA